MLLRWGKNTCVSSEGEDATNADGRTATLKKRIAKEEEGG